MFTYLITRRKIFPIVSDSDAQLFINAAQITSTTIANAINTFVIGLKTDSLWSKIKAYYPFVGGSAFSNKWNLKNPLNTDAAFRLIFNGTCTHNSNGFQAASGYAETFLTPSTTLSLNSASMFLWWTVADMTDDGYSGAKWTGGADYILLRNSGSISTKDAWVNNAGGVDFTADNPTLGFLGVSRISSSDKIRFIGNTNETVAQSSTNIPNVSINIARANGLGTQQRSTFGAFGIGDGLNTTEGGNLYSRINTLQIALGR